MEDDRRGCNNICTVGGTGGDGDEREKCQGKKRNEQKNKNKKMAGEREETV